MHEELDAVMTATLAPIDRGAAVALAEAQFGIEVVRAAALDSERDQNLHLVARDGREYVLKLANPVEPPAVTDLQTEALVHLAQVDPGLPVPRVISPTRGGHALRLDLGGPGPQTVRLLTYLQGVPLHKTTTTPPQLRALGAMLARLSIALRSFQHPAAGHALLWDLKHGARMRGLVGHIPEAAHREVAERFLGRAEAHALPALPRLRAQIVHGDLNPWNVLADPLDHARIAGIIDFGDCVHTTLINELAVASAYVLGTGDGEATLAPVLELVAAYHAVCALDAAELEILYDLIGLRLVMGLCINSWRATLYPENAPYLLANNGRTAERLIRLDPTPRAVAQERLRRACGLEG